MLHHMFVFGVVIPTVITIALFLGFLFCWFKFNMRERLFGKSTLKNSTPTKHEINGTIEEVVPYTSDSELCKKDTSFTNGKGLLDSRNSASGTTARNTGSVISSKTRQYVNLRNVQNKNNEAQSVNQTLRGGVTDSDGDTDYPRLTACNGGMEDYLSQNCCSGNQRGMINDLSCEPSSSELDNQTQVANNLVQHTYHFPDLMKNICKPRTCKDKSLIDTDYTIDSEDSCSEISNSDNCNYGHFVPVSQILEQGKEKKLTNTIIQENNISVI